LNVPAAPNVRWLVPDVWLSMFAGEPVVVNVTLCRMPLGFDQVTLPPL